MGSPLSKRAFCVSKSQLNKLCRTVMDFDPLLFCLSCSSAHILFSLFFRKLLFFLCEAHSDLGVSGTEASRIFYFLASRDIYFLGLNITSFFESFNSPLNFFGVTSEDVIHDIRIPSLNMKMDACPRRINSSLGFNHTRRVHYRTCSELCRVNHSYIPLQFI